MGLFKKKEKKLMREIVCPVCGKLHKVEAYQPQEYYLDGVPIDIKKALTQYVICDCGCLCQQKMDKLPDLEELIHSEDYQRFLHGDYEKEERKLCLMQILYWSFTRPEAWIIHSVGEEDYRAALERAIRIAEQVVLDIQPMSICQDIPAFWMPSLQTTGHLCLSQNMYLADLHRQMGQWERAFKYLEEEEKEFVHKEGASWRYILKQRDLIAAHNSDVL